jgi:DHA2 family multidrug resistance protein
VQSTLSGFAAAGMSPEQALAQVNQLVTQQAFMLAANDIFWLSALLFLVLIPLVWLTHPQRGGPGGSEAAAGAH